MSDVFCTACGSARSGSAPFCGRCGHGFAVVASEPERDVEATTNRASLHKANAAAAQPTVADPVPASVAAAAPTQTMSPAPNPPPPAPSAYPPPPPARGTAPPQVWLMAAGLVVLAGLIVWPVAEATPDVLTGAFDDNQLTRAFSTLFLMFVATFWACGAALVTLAVGLVRGSRVAQLLACLLAAITTISALVTLSRDDPDTVGYTAGETAGIVVCALLVVVLVTVPVSSRRFFDADPRPPGVSAAATANVYLGVVAMVNGMLICLAGVADVAYVWVGLALGLVGAALVVLSRGLHSGSRPARAMTLAVYAALVAAVVWFGVDREQLSQFPSLLPIGIALAGAIALTVPATSRSHFTGQGAPLPLRSGAVAAVAVAAIALLVAAAVGFSAATDEPEFASSGYSAPEPEPTPSSGTSDALETASAFLSALDGSGSASTCSATSTPDLVVDSYQVGEVTTDTDGSFDVSAYVTTTAGESYSVTYSVRDEAGSLCVDGDTFTTTQSTATTAPAIPAADEPSDVPGVVSADDPVPTDAALPETPAGDVVPYGDGTTVPGDESEIVEYQPSDLDTDRADAVRSVIAFMTHVNRQDFQTAWDYSTERLVKPVYDSSFARGYATSHFMQVAFGEPEQVGADLVIVPGRFVSRQDPAAQGDPSGVTDCSFWPQYMFLVAKVDGRWLVDVARKYQSDDSVQPYERQSAKGLQLNPVEQRVTC